MGGRGDPEAEGEEQELHGERARRYIEIAGGRQKLEARLLPADDENHRRELERLRVQAEIAAAVEQAKHERFLAGKLENAAWVGRLASFGIIAFSCWYIGRAGAPPLTGSNIVTLMLGAALPFLLAPKKP